MLGNQLHSETSRDGRPRAWPKSNWRSLSATLAPSIVVCSRDSPHDHVAEMVIGAPPEERACRRNGSIPSAPCGSFAAGDAPSSSTRFHCARWFKEWTHYLSPNDDLSPNDAVRLAGVEPATVTDVDQWRRCAERTGASRRQPREGERIRLSREILVEGPNEGFRVAAIVAVGSRKEGHA
jgi:hypothetical protein